MTVARSPRRLVALAVALAAPLATFTPTVAHAAEPVAVEGQRAYVRPTEADGFDGLAWGADLKALYGSADVIQSGAGGSVPSPAQLTLREAVFERYRARYSEMKDAFHSAGFKQNLVDINNASVIADSLYYDRLWVFEEVFLRSGSSLVDFIAAMKELGERSNETGEDPYLELERINGGMEIKP